MNAEGADGETEQTDPTSPFENEMAFWRKFAKIHH